MLAGVVDRLCADGTGPAFPRRTAPACQHLPEHTHPRPRGKPAQRDLRPQRWPPRGRAAGPDLPTFGAGHHRHGGRQLLHPCRRRPGSAVACALLRPARGRCGVRWLDHPAAACQTGLPLAGTHTDAEGERSHPFRRNKPPLRQGHYSRGLSERALLRQFGLWRRRRRATYFNKSVSELSLAEAALLAGLPQLPAYYDPYAHPDRAKNGRASCLG